MLFVPEPKPLSNASLTATAHEGLKVMTLDGKPARLAIIDEDGNILEAGDGVAIACWCTTGKVLRNFLQGQGHLRVRIPDDIDRRG